MAWKVPEQPLTRSQILERSALKGGEVCAYAGVSEHTVRAWAREGILPEVRIGHRVFYPVDGLLALLGDNGERRVNPNEILDEHARDLAALRFAEVRP